MKRSNKLPLVFAFMVFALSTSIVFANEPVIPAKANITSTYNDFTVFSEEEYDQIEANMLAGIKSDNTGLQTSCAYFLGEMKSDKSLIHLIKLARSGNTEESRIIAGLSLYKIESDIGMYLLKGFRESDDSEKVRRSFDKIYKKYISDNRSFDL